VDVRTESLLQIEGDLGCQQKLPIEPVEAVLASRSQNLELHEILQVFGLDAEDRASPA
jgi:hypothetical protein